MTYIEVFIAEYGQVHDQLTEVINSLPDEALNWKPYAGGNSIAVLATHLVGNQVETLRTVREQPSDRNRPAEFAVDDASQAGLLALVDDARAVLAELAPQITPEQLERLVRRPAAPDNAYPGLYQLSHSVTHAREHVGQIWMTRDLWEAKPGA